MEYVLLEIWSTGICSTGNRLLSNIWVKKKSQDKFIVVSHQLLCQPRAKPSEQCNLHHSKPHPSILSMNTMG